MRLRGFTGSEGGEISGFTVLRDGTNRPRIPGSSHCLRREAVGGCVTCFTVQVVCPRCDDALGTRSLDAPLR